MYKFRNCSFIVFFVILLLSVFFFSACAFADTAEQPVSDSTLLFDNSDTVNVDVTTSLASTFVMIRNLGTIFAVIGVVGSGIQLITVKDSNADKVYRRIIYMLMAVAALWMLPAFIRIGKNLFDGGWQPPA